MSKKKAAKAKTVRGIRNLPAKGLTAKQADDVKGGMLKFDPFLKIGGIEGESAGTRHREEETQVLGHEP